ncbi:MAG: type II secretion system GspH family protein, partial [Acidobacteriia bacterium]|nr:type II secretion system GspH family protein [Terriglobia bacterium]
MMNSRKHTAWKNKRHSQSGMTLLEVVIALAILLIVSVNIMTVSILSIKATESQGHLSARTAEYAQDKMEQLLALAFTDTVSDTTSTTSGIITTASTGGTGLGVGGSSNPLAPVAGYVDYLDANGNPMAAGG